MARNFTATVLWGRLSTTCSNDTEIAQLAAPSHSRHQPVTDNGVKDGRSNWLAVTPNPLQVYITEPHERLVHITSAALQLRVQ